MMELYNQMFKSSDIETFNLLNTMQCLEQTTNNEIHGILYLEPDIFNINFKKIKMLTNLIHKTLNMTLYFLYCR